MGRSARRLWLARHLPGALLGQRRTSPAQRAPARILVLQNLLLGDTLMLAPLLAKLAERWPDAERFLSCPAPIAPLFAARPYGVRTLQFDPNAPASLQAIREQGPFDLVIIPAENRYTPLARAFGSAWVVGFGKDMPGWKNWLLDQAVDFPASPACFSDFAATLIDGPAPAPFGAQMWSWAPCQPYAQLPEHYAVLHLGASSPLKYWPAERWRSLAQWLQARGITPVWSAGARETELVRAADPQQHYPSMAGQLDLLQMAHFLRGARLLVCPDTGIAHLGRITGTPTVTLFGPGSPQLCGAGEFWRLSPYIALSEPIDCRDQHLTFRRTASWIQRCARRFGTEAHQCARARCMEKIGQSRVEAACAQLLHGTPALEVLHAL